MKYEAVIGLEIHAELKTKSKMFCRCKNDPFLSAPNENICPVCIGLPGALPVMNRKALEWTVMAGLALNCKINKFSKWDRKNYYYPDLPKGYQISQYDLPLCYEGFLCIGKGLGDQEKKKVGITRIHLEEDTGKLIHPKGEDYSLVDYNRSSVPLMELVTEPDIRTGREAAEFGQELQLILRKLGISEANMEKGEMRVEVNISLREEGTEKFGTKVEVKNLNSFMAVEKSIEYEMKRQAELLDKGEKIVQETRGWNEDKKLTFSQRVKETAMDYRYFPEPDLPPVELGDELIQRIREKLPELPEASRKRYQEMGVPENYANILTSFEDTGSYFDRVIAVSDKAVAKATANLLVQETVNFALKPEYFAELVGLMEKRVISATIGKEILKSMNESLKAPSEVMKEKDIKQISGEDELQGIVEKVIAGNTQAVQDYKNGKETAVGFLVGQVMKETRGQADPLIARNILLAALAK